MNQIQTAPRGAKEIFYNGQWRQVIHLDRDHNPTLNLKSDKRVDWSHGNSIKAAQKILELPDQQRKQVVKTKLSKQKEKELKEIGKVQRMSAAVRETYKQFLTVSEDEVEQEIKRLTRLLA